MILQVRCLCCGRSGSEWLWARGPESVPYRAAALGLANGVIGILFGCGVSLPVSKIAAWPSAISPLSVIVPAVFLGYYPARKAANLELIEALRFQ